MAAGVFDVLPRTRVWMPAIALAMLVSDAPAAQRVTGPFEAAPARSARLLEAARPMWPSKMKDSQREALAGRRAPASLRLLVVGCDFSDSLLWGRDPADFPGWPPQARVGDRIVGTDIPQFAASDSVYFDIQMRKVDDYFRTVSFGQFSLQWDVHPTLVNVDRPMAYYGDADSSSVRLVALAQEVISRIDDDVDFTGYDTLVLIHAGAGRETDILGDSPQQIFSNYLDRRDFQDAVEAGLLSEPRLSMDEGTIEHVLVLPESESQDPLPQAGLSGFFGTRGVYCFELGLRLGMLSLADFTPSGHPDSQGIGDFGLMGFGLFTGVGIVPAAPCAINRMLMGWVDAVEVTSDADLRIGAMDAVGRAVSDTLLVKVPITDREYFLLEYRLQDPNGDLFYTFDNLNPTLFPDYYDADSAFGDGTPTSSYDPATDTWESTLGSEWDWFMSENSARTPDRCQRAGGSGLYIWHVDERVIQQSIFDASNTINADPRHKGVDVEEADGIQDLDSSFPSAYFLGWDQDTWRGEGASRFGPDTVPSTDSADGLPTGITVEDISHVVVSTLPRDDEGNCTGYQYARAMTLHVRFATPEPPLPLVHQVRFEDRAAFGDVRLADLGAMPGSAAPDGAEEILQAGDGGRIYAFTGALQPWLVPGPAEPGVLAVATHPDGPPSWNGPPAVGDVDGDGTPDVVLAAGGSGYAFEGGSGAPLVTDAAAPGRLWESATGEIAGVPVLVGSDVATLAATAEPPYDVYCLVRDEADTRLTRLSVAGGASIATSYDIPGRAVSGPTLLNASGGPRLAWSFTDDGGAGIMTVFLADPTRWGAVDVEGGVAATPLLGYDVVDAGGLAFIDATGRAQLLRELPMLDGGDLAARAGAVVSVGDAGASPWSALVGGLERADGAPWLVRTAGNGLWAMGRSMATEDGFPYRPHFEGAAVLGPAVSASPVLVDLTGDGSAEIVWHDAVGRLHAVDGTGHALAGWPFAGPAEPAGSPAVGDVDGDGELELVVSGVFGQAVSIDAPSQSVSTRRLGTLNVYTLGVSATAHAPWRQGLGDARNTGRSAESGAGAGVATDGTAFAPASLFIQPNPATGASVRVRVQVRRSVAVEVRVVNVEGQIVTRLGPISVAGGSLLEENISIANLAGGFYLCQVEAAGERQTRVFTIAR